MIVRKGKLIVNSSCSPLLQINYHLKYNLGAILSATVIVIPTLTILPIYGTIYHTNHIIDPSNSACIYLKTTQLCHTLFTLGLLIKYEKEQK